MNDRRERAEELAALVDRIYGGAGDLVNLMLVEEAMKAFAEVSDETLERVAKRIQERAEDGEYPLDADDVRFLKEKK